MRLHRILLCFDSSSSSTTANQPVSNVTGAGAVSTQGATSPVTTGSSQSSTGSTSSPVTTNSGNGVQVANTSGPLSFGGTVFDGPTNLTLTTDQGTVKGAFAAIDQAVQLVDSTAQSANQTVAAALNNQNALLQSSLANTAGGQTSANNKSLFLIIGAGLLLMYLPRILNLIFRKK